MSEEERLPISEVLPGMEIHALAAGEVPVSVFAIVKTMNADGEIGWGFRTSEAPNREELLGALTVQVDLLRASLAADWSVDDSDCTCHSVPPLA